MTELFFFMRAADRRDLDSFPTRRSSDLSRMGVVRPDGDPRGRDGRPHPRGGRRRSEEHTSELQSLTNLVCRLLLEKQKNTTRRRTGSKTRKTHLVPKRVCLASNASLHSQ